MMMPVSAMFVPVANNNSHVANDRKQGMFADPDRSAVGMRSAYMNPEYQAAFAMFNRNGDGCIDLCDLCAALQAVKHSAQGGTLRALCFRPFSTNTVVFLAAKFGAPSGGRSLTYPEFAEMLHYLSALKQIFSLIDISNSGCVDVSELSRGLSLSGFNVNNTSSVLQGSDPLSLRLAQKVGSPYDADRDGVLTFDEFVQMRCEWDLYINEWYRHVPPGLNMIGPTQILQVLHAIQQSMEPVGALALHPALMCTSCFNSSFCDGLYFNSMFRSPMQFQPRTCEMLIQAFGSGSSMLTFEQFCLLMEFLKEQKKIFMQFDQNRNGKLELEELVHVFAANGVTLSAQQVLQIGQRYDQNNSGTIEFDEFLQMMAEWAQVLGKQPEMFSLFPQNHANANALPWVEPLCVPANGLHLGQTYRSLQAAHPFML